MDGSIVIAKSGSKVINLDAVQCGVAKEKNRFSFFAKAVRKIKEKGENLTEDAPLKVEKVKSNLVVEKDDVYARMSVKDKKAVTIKGSEFKPDKLKKERLDMQFLEKYGEKSKKPRATKSR
ncbi:MAG: hypothetical protein IJH12_01695 [Clostridia bacterium]|nr:hypothetical protein [Clostridia bacterium]